MDLQLICTNQKSKWKLQFERLLRRHVDPDQLKDAAAPNSWLYFRRTNPRKFEVYMDEDFELNNSQIATVGPLNRPDCLPKTIQIHSNDLLCIHVKGIRTDYVRFEEEWVETLPVETTSWDHYLLAKGKVEIASN